MFKTFRPLICIREPEENPTPSIGTLDQRINVSCRITMDQVLTPIIDFPKEEYTGSSRFASAESEENSNDSFEIQRMSLGPRGADILRKKFERNEAEAQAEKPPATQLMNMVELKQVIYLFPSCYEEI